MRCVLITPEKLFFFFFLRCLSSSDSVWVQGHVCVKYLVRHIGISLCRKLNNVLAYN